MYFLWLVLLSLLTLTGTKYVPDVTGTDIEIPSYSQLLHWFAIAGQERFQHPIPVLKSQESHQTFREQFKAEVLLFLQDVYRIHTSH